MTIGHLLAGVLLIGLLGAATFALGAFAAWIFSKFFAGVKMQDEPSAYDYSDPGITGKPRW